MNASASSGTVSPAAADAIFMGRALELAARGVALTSPNPMVGAVLVRKGKIVGEGFHVYDGVRHAEIVALEEAGDAARGATLYINLEPCCHKGRTGPCTNALILADVKRVVVAMKDPNPAVGGRGFKHLRAAGIEVSTGLREAEARRLVVLPYARGRARPPLRARPALAARHLEDRWISSPQSRAEVQRMRHASDALLTGIGTVLGDDPLLTDRTGLPRRRKLLRVVMDSTLRLPLRSQLVRSADGDVLVFTREREDSPKARALRSAGVEVVHVAGRGEKPDLRDVIAELGHREILSVLLEAGATLNSAALAAGFVDKIRVFLAPKIAGFKGVAAASNGFQAACDLQNVTMAQFGVDFAVEGYLHDVYRTR